MYSNGVLGLRIARNLSFSFAVLCPRVIAITNLELVSPQSLRRPRSWHLHGLQGVTSELYITEVHLR